MKKASILIFLLSLILGYFAVVHAVIPAVQKDRDKYRTEGAIAVFAIAKENGTVRLRYTDKDGAEQELILFYADASSLPDNY